MAKKKLTKKTAKKATTKTKPAKKTAVKTKKHNHDLPLQKKLQDKNWDPIKEILEITDEYDEGTPKRDPGKDYWGACCLESQDVDVPQDPKKKKAHKHKK